MLFWLLCGISFSWPGEDTHKYVHRFIPPSSCKKGPRFTLCLRQPAEATTKDPHILCVVQVLYMSDRPTDRPDRVELLAREKNGEFLSLIPNEEREEGWMIRIYKYILYMKATATYMYTYLTLRALQVTSSSIYRSDSDPSIIRSAISGERTNSRRTSSFKKHLRVRTNESDRFSMMQSACVCNAYLSQIELSCERDSYSDRRTKKFTG